MTSQSALVNEIVFIVLPIYSLVSNINTYLFLYFDIVLPTDTFKWKRNNLVNLLLSESCFSTLTIEWLYCNCIWEGNKFLYNFVLWPFPYALSVKTKEACGKYKVTWLHIISSVEKHLVFTLWEAKLHVLLNLRLMRHWFLAAQKKIFISEWQLCLKN